MPSSLLAVDDSVTMRKVLEDTFPGPEFRVVTANSPDAALQKLAEGRPQIVIADGALEPRNGYELCKEVKRLAPGTPVLLLSSKQNPFDAQKGVGAQVDDHIDKPFDTQEIIDKVRKLVAMAQPGEPARGVAVSSTSPSAAFERNQLAAQAAAEPPPPPAAAGPVIAKTKTLVYTPESAGLAEAVKPIAQATVEPVRVKASVTSTSALFDAGADRSMTGKLEGMGLTGAQIDAVLALSREVIERAVWEVVPVLAETLIKEEIARLTR